MALLWETWKRPGMMILDSMIIPEPSMYKKEIESWRCVWIIDSVRMWPLSNTQLLVYIFIECYALMSGRDHSDTTYTSSMLVYHWTGQQRWLPHLWYNNPLEHQLPLVSLLQSTRIQHCSGPMIAVPIEEQLHVLKKQPLHRAVMYLFVYCDIMPSIWLAFNSLLRGLVHERSGENTHRVSLVQGKR
jgi:hypothetical protein